MLRGFFFTMVMCSCSGTFNLNQQSMGSVK